MNRGNLEGTAVSSAFFELVDEETRSTTIVLYGCMRDKHLV